MLKTESSLKQLAKEVAEYLVEYIHVDRIVLFGSYLNGSPREDSDIDMVIVSRDFEKMSMLEKMDLLARASMAVDSRVELIGFPQKDYLNPSPVSLLAVIKKTGKVIYP